VTDGGLPHACCHAGSQVDAQGQRWLLNSSGELLPGAVRGALVYVVKYRPRNGPSEGWQ